MTKLWKKVPSVRTILDEMSCDLCDKKTKHDEWGIQNYEVAETEITIREGFSYPDGGYGTKITIDICTSCFKTKLIPWLIKQGVNIKEEKWDY